MLRLEKGKNGEWKPRNRRFKVKQKKKKRVWNSSEGGTERASGERGRKMLRKKKPGKQWRRKDKARAAEGRWTEGCRRKTLEKGRKRVKQKERLKVAGVDRQITTKLRLADSCESRIWYCGTDTQTWTCTRAHMHTQTGILQVCVCVCARTVAGWWGHIHMLTLSKRATLHIKY